MTTFETVVKYCAIALAIILIVAIFCTVIGIVAKVAFWLGGSSDTFFGDAVTDMQTFTVGEGIDELDIDISAAALDIVYSEEFRVESNLKHIKVSDSRGCLKISETKRFIAHRDDIVIKLYIPYSTDFKSVDISTGAGRVKIDGIHTEKLSLDIGAGDVEIHALGASKSAEIEGGAGRLTIDFGALANADIELGVGEVNITSALSGSCEIDSGIGSTDITIIGSKDNYSFDISTGIGKVTVDGEKIGRDSKFGSGTNHIKLDCGIGETSVKFSDERDE